MKTISIDLTPDSSLFFNGYPIIVGDTKFGGRAFVETYQNNNRETALHIEWMKRLASAHASINVVDVGSNVGMFARQALIAMPNLNRVFAYEPDIENFDALLTNLEPWCGRVTPRNYALGAKAGKFTLYRDASNSGNHSFLPAAMAGNEFDVQIASMRRAKDESAAWINAAKPILYKSDTQGYDELIATELDGGAWELIFAAVLEIWRIEKPAFDVDAFVKILERFPNRMLLNAQKPLTIKEAVDYLSGRDGQWDDLAIWK